MQRKHAMPYGAECSEDEVRFRLWAPKAEKVDLCFEGKQSASLAMPKDSNGWFEIITNVAKPGTWYRYLINGELRVPDPASRLQPNDVHGPSEVIDPVSFQWTDGNWRGRPWEEAVIYELHVGTFSLEGSFAGVESKLDHLADLGITAIELMPLSDFPGKRNWGYDGVLPFAPDSSYGRPEDLKLLIQSAHAKGLMVFLDVVYNHFGPDGNYLNAYSPQFFTERHHTPWGAAINFDGAQSRPVRDFFIHNALYWLEEFHFDGLRFDAVHAIIDDSKPDILVELAETVRNTLGKNRQIHLVLENGDNEARYLGPADERRARWYDAQWNDDIHHALHVLLTGEIDGYYSDYARQPIAQLGRCLTEGFGYQGDFSEYQKANRGEPSAHLPLVSFVHFLQNHDQIGNRAFGDRISSLTEESALKAAISLLLLAPSPPLLFMGEEFCARTPFLFFCDFSGDLAAAVTNGRRSEFASFTKFSASEHLSQIPDPNAEKTFADSKLNWQSLNEATHQEWFNSYRELLKIRRATIVPLLKHSAGNSAKYSVTGRHILTVSWKFEEDTLALVANMGNDSPIKVRRPEGELIYSTAPTTPNVDIELNPWQVSWFLKR